MSLPEGLRVEAHEDWGVRLVVPDRFFYDRGVGGIPFKLEEFFEVSRKFGFTADNIVDVNGNPPSDKDDTFPEHPKNPNESMIIRRLAFAESLATLVSGKHD